METAYKKINNVTGWAVFALATIVYVLTVEPTTSFWDCGEYIATSVKLQIGHPPGAPLFQLLGAVFAIFAMGDWTQMAYWINIMSALSSSFTILFLFWTITALGRKMAERQGALNQAAMLPIMASGVVGALAYTFSDSFWFSAVEGEVYAMSSLFTAMAFWAVFKWEREADSNPRANRWLIFIAYVVGLSVGVHILVFLTIPAISVIYFFKRSKEINTWTFIKANGVGIIILGFVFSVLIPFVLNMFGKLELWTVNALGLPFDSGTILSAILLFGFFGWGLWYTAKTKKVHWNTAILCVFFILLGYSSFITLAVRSNANPPIDENNPEDATSLLSYYKREQYGDLPLLYGQYFNAPLDRNEPFKDGKPTYERDEEAGRYVVVNDGAKQVQNFDPRYKGFLPRMWSPDPRHADNYVKISGMKSKDDIPTFGQNIKFMWSFQFGYMYWRYFLWNFSGRQNDEQGHLELTRGNWISGIPFLDSLRLGPQKNLPHYMATNKARNTYFLLPLILGIIGLIYHYYVNKEDAWAVTLVFLFTGLAVLVYTNQRPFEPRERDYAVVGSFYAYAMWIGLGVYALIDIAQRKLKHKLAPIGISVLTLLLVPGLMAKENWDDHDRSNRYTARDIAKAYLDSCEPNAILFTNGDNDTFPLWYVQEVEGYRTDVRVVNLSLLNTDWYIDQMKRKAYDADAVPFTFERSQYVQGTRDVLYFMDRKVKSPYWDIDKFINTWVKNDADATHTDAFGGRRVQYFPIRKLRVKIDKDAVLANNVVDMKDTAKIVDQIMLNMGNISSLSKRDIMVLDLIANNNWERPIYFSITVGSSAKDYFWLTDHFRLEGLAYRYVPVKNEESSQGFNYGFVDTERMYDNLMNKFAFGNANDPRVYLDETNRRMASNFRNIYGRLASALAKEGEKEKAVEVLDRIMDEMPEHNFPYNFFVLGIIEAYYEAGATDKAVELVNQYADRLEGELKYYRSFTGNKRKAVNSEVSQASQYFQYLVNISSQYDGTRNNIQESELFQRYQRVAR
ncbi:MAG: DUF2723 domain-containing protein [Cryomorphaceae bacterium]|nr:DUF2723 domain-containing protein [Cryomorphaceae bacterium]